MDIQTKHRVELLNAKCNYVCNIDSIYKKMKYGEEIDSCCVENLWLASKLINRLECHCFSDLPLVDEEIKAVFSFSVNNNTILDTDIFFAVSVNEVYLSNYTTDGTETRDFIYRELLEQLRFDYLEAVDGTTTTFVITANCDTTSIARKKVDDGVVTVEESTLVTAGACATTSCVNCTEDKDLNKMYAVLNQLLA